MSESGLQTQGGLESQPVMPVRRLNNYVYCPRLFYFQWVENLFEESADTVAGKAVHRNVDAPSRFDDQKQEAFSEGLCAWGGCCLSWFHHPMKQSAPRHGPFSDPGWLLTIWMLLVYWLLSIFYPHSTTNPERNRHHAQV